MKRNWDSRGEDYYRGLVRRAAKEFGGLAAVARATGCHRVRLQQWLEGRRNRKGKMYHPSLPGDFKVLLLKWLARRYPESAPGIETTKRQEQLRKLGRVATPWSEEREIENALRNRGGIPEKLSRAGIVVELERDVFRSYTPEGGLTRADYDWLAPLLDEDFREELDRITRAGS